MDSALGPTIDLRLRVDAEVAVEFLTYVAKFRPGSVRTLPETAPPVPVADGRQEPADAAVPSPEQVRIFWDGLLEMGAEHGIVRIVDWWLSHPGHHHRTRIAADLGLYPAQVSNWMRTLRHYLRRAHLPYELYAHRDGMGIDEPYAGALRAGRPEPGAE